MQDWGWDGIPRSWFYGIWSLHFLETRFRNRIEQGDVLKNKREVCSPPHTIHKRKQSQSDQWFGYCWFYSLKRPIFSSGSFVACVWRQRSSDQDDHNREEVRQWDMFPGLTELLLIGCLIESIWTPRSKSNTLTPKTNSQTFWPKEISHVMNGIIFCV